MKPIHQHFIVAALLLLCAIPVSAQTPIDVTFTPATSTVAVGANVAIQMKVVNFKNIATIQFPIVFNKDVLQLVSVTGAHAALQNFHVDFADPDPNLALTPGKLAVSWNYNGSNQPNGATIAANGVFFTLNFKVLSACSSAVNLSGTANPMIDVTNTSSQAVAVNYQNGAATITAGPCTTNPPTVTPPIQGFHIIANTIYIPSGEVGCMPVTANDFENIQSMAYAMNWNPLILQVVGTRAVKLTPTDIQFGNFNNTGRQSMLWYTPNALNTRPDFSSLYEVCFQAVGNPGTNTLVNINGNGFPQTGGAEILQVNNGTTKDIWRDTTGITDTIFIPGTTAPNNAIAYTAEKDTVVQNVVGCMEVRVANFTNSTYGEFALTYDSVQLQFDHFNLGANPLGLDTSSSSPTNTENFLKFQRLDIVNQAGEDQTLRYLQFAYRNSNGLTLPNNTVAFSACFKAIGAPSVNGTSIPVKIGSYLDPGNAFVPIGAARKTVGAVPIAYTSGSVFIKSASALSATTSVQNATCGGSNGSIALTVTNCGGNPAYNWTGPGINASNINVQNPTGLTAGTYAVTVTCSSGTTTASATVAGASSITLPAPTITSVTCNGGTDGTISIAPTGGGGNYTYVWSGPAGFSSTSANPTGLRFGNNYKVTITDASNCTFISNTYTVPEPNAIGIPPANITMISVKCKGSSDGAITLPAATGGTAPYTYAWTGPSNFTANTQSISGLKAGSYVVVVTDSKNCGYTHTPLQVAEPASVSISSPVVSNVNCSGGNSGAIQVTVTGGTEPYTYSWRNTASGTVVSVLEDPANLAAGSYAVTATDVNSCTATNTATINGSGGTAPNVSNPTVSDVKCFNGTDGAIQITVTGGTAPFNYSWKNTASGTPVSTLEDPANLAAGNYAVTVTDASSCTTTVTATINGPFSPLAVTETHVDAACSGSNTGSINLNITGGWSNSTVAWPSPLLPQTSLPNLAPGSYTATVTDQRGCVVTIPVVVGAASAIALGNYTQSNVTCFGQANGGIVIFPSGGGSGTTYNVSWTGGLSGTAISNLSGGNYIPTVTNQASGCTAVFPAITITEPTPIEIDTTITAQSGATDNGAITVDSVWGGSPSYVFSWTGPNGFTGNTGNLSGLAAGSYLLTITDANLCIYTTVANVVNASDPDPLAGTTVASVKDACSNDGCIKLVIAPTATFVPFTISWNSGTPMVTSQFSPEVCGLMPGIYNITVTDAAGHSTVLPSQIIAQLPTAPVGAVTNEPFDAQMDGSIVLSPVQAGAPLTYKWNTGSMAGALVNLDSGTYIVTVTHSLSGCTSVYSYHLNRKYLPAQGSFGTIVQPGCLNASTGAIAFNFSGGNGPNYQYNWSGPNGFTANTRNISGLPAGTYTLTVVDESGTPYTYDTTLTDQSQLAVTNVNETSFYAGFQVSSSAACDGKATVSFSGQSGDATIAWSNGVNTISNITLCGGAYSVTVTDQLGCSSVWSDSLTAPAGVVPVVVIIAPVTCSGKCDGIAQVGVGGGVAPYVVRWALPGNQFQIDQLVNAASFSIADNLCGGNYAVTITDDNGIVTLTTVTILNPPALTATFNQNLPTRFNSCDGETMITAQGASGTISYSWSGNNGHTGNDARATGLCAGEAVIFTIVDEKGCTTTAGDTIAYPEGGCLLGSPVITPGERDGKNDELYITCAETVENTVEIFNRWGQMVFNVTNYDNNSVVWTGTTRSGATLPEGVYFYVMTFTDDQGTEQRIKGYVNLLR